MPQAALRSHLLARLRRVCRAHEALIKEHLGHALIGHLSRDATAIEARERPAHTGGAAATAAPAAPSSLVVEEDTPAPTPPAKKRGRGHPRRGEDRAPAHVSPVQRQRQRQQSVAQMIEGIPTVCDRGTKCNAQGYKVSWNGYKLHLDIADCGVPIAALLSSASMHDSRAAIPLSLISAQRVTNLYDLMDAVYCSFELHEHCRSLGHVPSSLLRNEPESMAFRPSRPRGRSRIRGPRRDA